HEFVLASVEDNNKHAELMKKYPDMEHDDPNGKSLAPNKTADIVWRFTRAGEFEFACLIPGHREAGMHGVINVK
ncbi:MAG: copper resistance protein, partial [Rhizobiales bacterium]|nr:copper resistance protein [Hyphomicrobiales bacterium]